MNTRGGFKLRLSFCRILKSGSLRFGAVIACVLEEIIPGVSYVGDSVGSENIPGKLMLGNILSFLLEYDKTSTTLTWN
jgi:hypothetical protein